MTQPILPELKYFINGLSGAYRPNMPPDVGVQLVKSSLILLDTLPAARELILEFFGMVFDNSVGNYMTFIEVN